MRTKNNILNPARLAQIRTLLKFGTVGGSGIIVNNAVLWALTSIGMGDIVSSILATETAIITNFIGNSLWTWSDHNTGSWQKRFLMFQGISLIAGALTVLLFYAFKNYLGLPLLIANTTAILITFIINFTLNSKFTWRRQSPAMDVAEAQKKRDRTRDGKGARTRTIHAITLLAIAATFGALIAQSTIALVSVSQMGYHPDGYKTVTVYTSMTGVNYSVVRSDGVVMKNAPLARPLDQAGNPVNCQGNNTCIVGDFSDVKTKGTYHITTEIGENSSDFSISGDIYKTNAQVFNEFYDALRQQHSTYHADMNNGTDPALTMMADGSFIMTSDQAALTLIRLSDAYRRNPTLLSADTHDFVRPNTPDMAENIISYAAYLESLQDANILQRTDGVGFRLSTAMKVHNAFVPGPTNLTNLTVYYKNGTYNGTDTHAVLDIVPMASLCGGLNGTAYDSCVADAALYYKCQVDEPCLNVTYDEKTGTRLAGRKPGYGLPNGWTYEFGCFYDTDLQHGNFNSAPNPCLIYDRTETREQTVNALLAYTEAITPVNLYDPAKARELLDRAVQTQQYIIAAYPAFIATDNDTGAWGAANFLLYDLTNGSSYLDAAYGVRDSVSPSFVSDGTHGNEFYWQEYIRHNDTLINASHEYLINGTDPRNYLSNQMYGDYYNGGDMTKISKTGERVYQFDPNIQFQNSRYMLTEGLLAAKTGELSSDNASFIGNIADAQLSWLTGNNGVQDGVSLNASIISTSFIFGIGRYPTQFHSRLLMSSGYSNASDGAVVGMRGTGYQFYNGSDYIYLDGKTTILGSTLGAQGNGYRNETQAPQFDANRTFTNNKTYIPGWINGAFDVNTDLDTIFNYRDDRSTYEFTETTNEIVATAVSLFAYRDAWYNGVTPLAVPFFGQNNGSAHVSITSTPIGAEVWYDAAYKGMTTPLGNVSFDTPAGNHTLQLNLTNCSDYMDVIQLAPGENLSLSVILNCTLSSNDTNATNATTAAYAFDSTPTGASISIDTTPLGVTPLSIDLASGTHMVALTMTGYRATNDTIVVTGGIPRNVTYTLTADTNSSNATLVAYEFASTPAGANISIDAVPAGTTPLHADLAPGTHTVSISLEGYIPLNDSVFVSVGSPQNVSYNLFIANNSNTTNGTNATNSTPPTLIYSVTNATQENGEYTAYEMHDASFTAQYDMNTTINWYVNDVLVRTSHGDRDTLVWGADILYTSDRKAATITAASDGVANATFRIIVKDYINPFWRDVFGAPDAILEVFTSNQAHRFTNATAELYDTRSGLHNVTLEYTDANESTNWKIQLTDMANGNTVLRSVTVIDTAINSSETYSLTQLRAHYRYPRAADPSGGGRSGGGGGFLPGDDRPGPQLVYVILSKDVVKEGESLDITLDAKSDRSTTKVNAVFADENGSKTTVPLSLVNGTNTYGTWTAVLKGGSAGKHTLAKVVLTDAGNRTTNAEVTDRSYYVLGDIVASDEHLGLVYALLDNNTVDPGKNVTIRIDARDANGVRSATALLKDVQETHEDVRVPLTLAIGTQQYGTWEGSATLKDPDTTYSLYAVLLSDGESEREVRVYNQKVYVNYVKPEPSPLTGMVTGLPFADGKLGELARRPTTPLIIGLIGMAIAMLIVGMTFSRKQYP